LALDVENGEKRLVVLNRVLSGLALEALYGGLALSTLGGIRQHLHREVVTRQ